MSLATTIADSKTALRSRISAGLRRHPVLRGRLLFLLPHILEHPLMSKPRYGHGQPAHPQLAALLEAERPLFADSLRAFMEFAPELRAIPQNERDPRSPCWRNFFFTGLDALALYGYIATRRPRRYIEVGSGYSTRLARRAVTDQGLATHITAIDPQPRVAIEAIADRVVRQPVEQIDLATFDALQAGDILFIDNSHRVFMNSDACVVFMDILPRLASGVLVHVHDIFLPFDYPDVWVDRYYSEQYLLGGALLAGATRYATCLPNAFIDADAELAELTAPLWQGTMAPFRRWIAPSSYWFTIA